MKSRSQALLQNCGAYLLPRDRAATVETVLTRNSNSKSNSDKATSDSDNEATGAARVVWQPQNRRAQSGDVESTRYQPRPGSNVIDGPSEDEGRDQCAPESEAEHILRAMPRLSRCLAEPFWTIGCLTTGCEQVISRLLPKYVSSMCFFRACSSNTTSVRT